MGINNYLKSGIFLVLLMGCNRAKPLVWDVNSVVAPNADYSVKSRGETDETFGEIEFISTKGFIMHVMIIPIPLPNDEIKNMVKSAEDTFSGMVLKKSRKTLERNFNGFQIKRYSVKLDADDRRKEVDCIVYLPTRILLITVSGGSDEAFLKYTDEITDQFIEKNKKVLGL